MINVHVNFNGNALVLDGREGQTLMQLLKAQSLPLEGLCGGSMDCATCHVIVAPDWAGELPEASEDEEDMLDLIPESASGSRLSCQIHLTAALDQLRIAVPHKEPGSE